VGRATVTGIRPIDGDARGCGLPGRLRILAMRLAGTSALAAGGAAARARGMAASERIRR
jgi:hypothetical protein